VLILIVNKTSNRIVKQLPG